MAIISLNIFFIIIALSGIKNVTPAKIIQDETEKQALLTRKNQEHGPEFKYEEADPLGPAHWQEVYHTCSGKYQSPIDIEESLVTRVSLPPIQFTGTAVAPLSATATNNGHTVQLKYNFTEPVTIVGGPLFAPIYEFTQLHFHWGVNDSVGSEDFINNHSYPMELHMVFYNKDFNNSDFAMYEKEGLTVLAFFIEVGDEENKAFSEIINSLNHISYPQTSITLKQQPPLMSLMPKNLVNYFTYIGSLTTPPCVEGVRWIDFKHPIILSHEQLGMFRTLHSSEGLLTHNSRPIQPTSNRPVWYNTASTFKINKTIIVIIAFILIAKFL